MAGELNSSGAATSAALAHFIATTQWEDVPAAVRHEAKRALINFFATALAGCKDPAVAVAAAVFGGFRAQANCTVIGRGESTDALHAAALNAMSANVFDFDDTHLPTIIHPTAPVAPALLALAQSGHGVGAGHVPRPPLSGRDLLLAFVVGVEVECRLGNAVSPGHYQRGWHITSTCGVFGAAAASARALQFDPQRALWALGNAAAQSSGLVETLGSMAKSIGVGHAASNGLLSALLAEQGFQGPAYPVEGPRGFLHVTGDEPDVESVTQGLGERWELMNNTYKPYPCGVVLNPVIEACLALHRRVDAMLDDIERVELTGHPLLRQRTDRPDPRSGREAQVSAQHAVAVCLVRGKAGLDEFSDACVREPEWRAWGAKLSFVDDPAYGIEAATVVLTTKGGKVLTHHVQTALGSLQAPLSDRALETKLETLAAWGASGCTTPALAEAIWSLDRLDRAADLMPLVAGDAQR